MGRIVKTKNIIYQKWDGLMHELGVLKNAIKTVTNTAKTHGIKRIKFITLEIGSDSTFVPLFLEKLFPVAIDGLELFKNAQLKLHLVPGKGLVIKEIGY